MYQKLRETDPNALKDRYKRDNLRKYGITLEQYNRQFERQNGLCAICEVYQSEFKRDFAVDHCHHTGKVRGLLCASCNSGIGKLQDNTDLLKSAILYLENPSWRD
jgi:hypothetical protein